MDRTLSLQDLAVLTKARLVGNPHYRVSNVADLDSAQAEDVSFLGNARYEQAMRKSMAGAIFVAPTIELPSISPLPVNFLIVENPSFAFQQAIDHFHPQLQEELLNQFIHPSAVIGTDVSIGKGTFIGPNVVIENGVQIGDQTIINAGCYVGPHVKIGNNCLFHANASVREGCVLHNHIILQTGAVIGACGFGYIQDAKGRHIKLRHVGNVILEDDVEIGSNSVIERARFKTTLIGRGTKIGNLVVIGHNVTIGHDTIVVSQTGIAGSTKIGNHVILAAQVGVVGHIEIGDGIMVGAKSGISKSLTTPGKYQGVPAVPLNEHQRHSVHLRHVGDHADQIKDLKKRIEFLEKQGK